MNVLQSYTDFEKTLNEIKPPEFWSDELKSVWHQTKGDWDKSHDIAQNIHTPMGSLIHAHLHRVEGDDWNAKYWYKQADRSFPSSSLEEELKSLVKEIIEGP
ncbi:hypothetical protein [Leeuwenhoekiella marinoflava]|uniref:hypothetical protein n=1 Tax=Leeuwenhoekiella marinoflava TaxID=988 RepID=UPI003003959B